MTAPNIPHWSVLTAIERADAVLEWCLENGIDIASIQDYQLAASMAKVQEIAEEDGITCDQAPMDYVNLIRVLAAFLRSRI